MGALECLWPLVVSTAETDAVQWETLAGAGAVLVGVVLTGLWAERRQVRALAAERDRLDRQLAAERERLERQHAHDRHLADLAELRSLLDSAAEDLNRLEDEAIAVTVLQEQLKEADSRDGERELADAVTSFVVAAARTTAMTDRIALRIGREHALVSLHATALRNLRRGIQDHVATDLKPNSEQVEEQNAALGAFQADMRSFIDAARRFVASRLPESE